MFRKLLVGDKTLAFFAAFFTLFHIYNLVIFSQRTSWDILFLFVLITLRLLFQNRFSFQRDKGKSLFWLYFEAAFTVHFTLGHLLVGKNIAPYTFLLFNFGLSFLLGISLLLKSSKGISFEPDTTTWRTTHIYSFIILFFGLFFGLSYLSNTLNITKMGFPHAQLPYKLEPALNLFRNVSIPLTTTLFFHYFKKARVLITALFVLWLTYESYIRGSRGAIIAGTLPLLIYLAHKAKVSTLFKGTLILSVLSFGLFIGAKFIRASFNNDTYRVQPRVEKEVWDFYSRLFNDPPILLNLNRHYGSKEDLFKFRAKKLKEYGGGTKYYTHEVMLIPKKTIHNEGLTALSDGVLQFGTFGFFITIPFILLLFQGLDRRLIPFFSSNLATTSIGYYGLLNCLIWGTGFWDFFINRSIMTICVFPLTTIAVDQALKFLTKRPMRLLYANR